MKVFCTAKHCPLSASCSRRRDQVSTDTDYYTDFSHLVEATLKGFQCHYFEHKRGHVFYSGGTEAIG